MASASPDQLSSARLADLKPTEHRRGRHPRRHRPRADRHQRHQGHAIKDGPSEYREIHRELSSLNIALTSLQEGANDPESLLNRKGRPRKQDLLDIVANCRKVVDEVQSLIDKHSRLQANGRSLRRVWDAYRVGTADLDTLRGRLTFYTSTIDMFLHSLEGPALARIEGMVRMLVANMEIAQNVPGSSRRSIASVASTATILSILDPDQEGEAWRFLRAELMAEGILPSHLTMYKMDIIRYLKTLVAGVETPQVSGVLDQGIEPVKPNLYLEDMPAPTLVSTVPSDTNEWKKDSMGQFESRLVTRKYGILNYGSNASRAALLLCFEVRAVTTVLQPDMSPGYLFGLQVEPVRGGAVLEEAYPNARFRYIVNGSSQWEISLFNPHSDSHTQKSVTHWWLAAEGPRIQIPYEPPRTFRLAAFFRISGEILGAPVTAVITMQQARPLGLEVRELSTRFVVAPDAKKSLFT